MLDPLEIVVLRDQCQPMVLGEGKLIRIIEIQAKVLVGMQDGGVGVLIQVQQSHAGERVLEKRVVSLCAPATEGDDPDGVEGEIGQGALT